MLCRPTSDTARVFVQWKCKRCYTDLPVTLHGSLWTENVKDAIQTCEWHGVVVVHREAKAEVVCGHQAVSQREPPSRQHVVLEHGSASGLLTEQANQSENTRRFRSDCTHTRARARTNARLHARKHARTHTSDTHTHKNTRTKIHVHTHTHTHTHVKLTDRFYLK